MRRRFCVDRAGDGKQPAPFRDGQDALKGSVMVSVETADGVSVLTLNRPEAMNALSLDLRAALAEALRAAEADADVRVVVLTGAGRRAFCAGLDLKEFRGEVRPIGGAVPTGADPVQALAAVTKPVIAAVNGVAITGGFELVLACDVIIASENARFADTHARVGVAPGWGLSQRLSRAVGVYRAKELSLSGNFLDASTAMAWGLVNRVVEADALLPTALALARDMASAPTDMIGFYKALIDDGFDLPFGEAMALEQTRSGAWNRSVTSASVAANRAGVMARGRAQKAAEAAGGQDGAP